MNQIVNFFFFLAVIYLQGQTNFSKGTYILNGGVASDGYIENRNWEKPFDAIRFKKNLDDTPQTIATTNLSELKISPHYEFVRQMVWKAPTWTSDQQLINYNQKEAVFLKVVGYGKVSLYTYFEGNTQHIVYQIKPNRFVELVPPSATPSKTGRPLDYKDQIKADFKNSFYQERDLKQLPYSLLAITEFIRNYNSYLNDNTNVAYSEVVRSATVPRDESDEEANSEVPFAIVEKSPVYQGCEKQATEEEIRTCLSIQLKELFNKEFKYPKEANPADKSKKMYVQFLIEKDGSVQLKTLRVAHPSIDLELRRVFGKIQRLKPGLMRNKPVSVIYTQVFSLMGT